MRDKPKFERNDIYLVKTEHQSRDSVVFNKWNTTHCTYKFLKNLRYNEHTHTITGDVIKQYKHLHLGVLIVKDTDKTNTIIKRTNALYKQVRDNVFVVKDHTNTANSITFKKRNFVKIRTSNLELIQKLLIECTDFTKIHNNISDMEVVEHFFDRAITQLRESVNYESYLKSKITTSTVNDMVQADIITFSMAERFNTLIDEYGYMLNGTKKIMDKYNYKVTQNHVEFINDDNFKTRCNLQFDFLEPKVEKEELLFKMAHGNYRDWFNKKEQENVYNTLNEKHDLNRYGKLDFDSFKEELKTTNLLNLIEVMEDLRKYEKLNEELSGLDVFEATEEIDVTNKKRLSIQKMKELITIADKRLDEIFGLSLSINKLLNTQRAPIGKLLNDYKITKDEAVSFMKDEITRHNLMKDEPTKIVFKVSKG